MTKEDYKIQMLSAAAQEMKEVCNKLICAPQLKEKAEALREEIRKEYESVESASKTESSTDSRPLDLDFVIDYLEKCIKNGKRVWCLCPSVNLDMTCNPEDIKRIILELKSDSDSYGRHIILQEKGTEGPRFHREIPRSDYEKAKCFLQTNNSLNFVEIQYY